MYIFRGTYNGVDCELDEVVAGGRTRAPRQCVVDDETEEWFDANLRDRVIGYCRSVGNKTY